MEIKSKKCKKENFIKAGFVKGEQRYKCKECGCQYVPTREGGRGETLKLQAISLYVHGLSFRTIGKLLGVAFSSVCRWIKIYAEENYEKPKPSSNKVIIELDEMWHYLKSKKTKSGYGKRIVEKKSNLSTGNVDQEIQKLLKNFTKD